MFKFNLLTHEAHKVFESSPLARDGVQQKQEARVEREAKLRSIKLSKLKRVDDIRQSRDLKERAKMLDYLDVIGSYDEKADVEEGEQAETQAREELIELTEENSPFPLTECKCETCASGNITRDSYISGCLHIVRAGKKFKGTALVLDTYNTKYATAISEELVRYGWDLKYKRSDGGRKMGIIMTFPHPWERSGDASEPRSASPTPLISAN